MDTFDLKKINLYELFEVSTKCSVAEIKKAYRKKALIHHPDKNPDDPKAKEIFQKLSKALEILSDEKARASYDKILNARTERILKEKKLDGKRKKLREDLEAKEKNYKESIIEEEERLKQEIERLRKEGSKQLEEENLLLKKKIEEQQKENSKISNLSNIIKVKLKRNKRMEVELTENFLKKKFSHFGVILSIIKHKKSALLEYEKYDSLKSIATNCPDDFEFEIISVNKINNQSDINNSVKLKDKKQEQAIPTIFENNDNDYEDYIMKRMAEAELKKRKSIE